MHGPFTLLVNDANGNTLTALDTERIDNLSISTQEPGGCLECSFRFHISIRTVPYFLGANYDLRVIDHEGCFWRGRLERVDAVRTQNAEWWDITAVGYGAALSDQHLPSTNLQNTVTTTGITDTLTYAAAILSQVTHSIEASGVTLTNTAAITRAWDTPAERINFLKRFGYSDNSQMLAHIYPHEQSAWPQLTVKKRSTTAEYTMYLADATGRFGFDFANYANRVDVVYNNGASNTTRNDTAGQGISPDGVNIIKSQLVSIPEITNATDAAAAGDAVLAHAKRLRMDARELRVSGRPIILDANGQSVGPWRVRAGKVLQLLDLVPAGLSNIEWNNSMLITRTVWDDTSQVLSITPENAESGIDALVARARNASEAGSRIV